MPVLEPLYFAVSLLGLLLATFTDLKTREIPDKLSYALIGFGLGGHFFESVTTGNYFPFLQTLAVTALTFGGAYALWKGGVWAGGDVKLFTGLAALNPVNYAFLRPYVFPEPLTFLGRPDFLSTISLPLFPLALFVFSVLAMMPYGVLLSLQGLASKVGVRRRFLDGFARRALQLLEFSLLGVGLQAVLYDLRLDQLLVWPVLLVAAFFLPPLAWHAAAVFSFAYAVYLYWLVPVLEAARYFLPLFAVYVLLKLYLVSKDAVLKAPMKTAELAEGVIVAHTLVEQANKQIVEAKPPRFAELLHFLKRLDFKGLRQRLALPAGRILANSLSAAGLTAEEALELRQFAAQRRLPETLLVKLSAPFVPAVLLGYLLLQAVGDVLWKLVLP